MSGVIVTRKTPELIKDLTNHVLKGEEVKRRKREETGREKMRLSLLEPVHWSRPAVVRSEPLCTLLDRKRVRLPGLFKDSTQDDQRFKVLCSRQFVGR